MGCLTVALMFTYCIHQGLSTRHVSRRGQFLLMEKKESQIEEHYLKLLMISFLLFSSFLFSVSFAGLGTDPRASHMLTECSTTEVHLNPNMHVICSNWRDTYTLPLLLCQAYLFYILFLISTILYDVKNWGVIALSLLF